MEIILKRATLGDIDEVFSVEKSVAGLKIYSGLDDKDDVAEYINKSFFYLIKKDGKIVGDVSYELKDPDHAYINGLVVMPQFQGLGIAKQSMRMILAELANVKIIDLVTHPDNDKAISLYESLGFGRVAGIIENCFGDGEPRIKMVLEK